MVNQISYIIGFLIALIIAFTYGRKRNIGLYWSIFFCVFVNFFAIPIIFLSKKKTDKEPPNLVNMGLLLLLLNFFSFYAEREKFINETIIGFSVPIIIFTQNISPELAGFYIGRIIFLILAIYFLLRKLTFDNLIFTNYIKINSDHLTRFNMLTPKKILIIVIVFITVISSPFVYIKYTEFSKLKSKEESEQKLVELKSSLAKLKSYVFTHRKNIGLDSIKIKTKYVNGNMLFILKSVYLKDNSYFQTSVNSLNISFDDKDGFTIYKIELIKSGAGFTTLVNDKNENAGFMFESKYPMDINIYKQFSDISIGWQTL